MGGCYKEGELCTRRQRLDLSTCWRRTLARCPVLAEDQTPRCAAGERSGWTANRRPGEADGGGLCREGGRARRGGGGGARLGFRCRSHSGPGILRILALKEKSDSGGTRRQAARLTQEILSAGRCWGRLPAPPLTSSPRASQTVALGTQATPTQGTHHYFLSLASFPGAQVG